MLISKNEIEQWLQLMEISNYSITDDLSVNVYGNVDLKNRGLTTIPVQFGIVEGNFVCSHNKLKNLIGSPKLVLGNMICSYNRLNSLRGCPKKINGMFVCFSNNLRTLLHAPDYVGGKFNAGNNPLVHLKGFNTQFEYSFEHTINGKENRIEEFKELYLSYKFSNSRRDDLTLFLTAKQLATYREFSFLNHSLPTALSINKSASKI